MIGKTQYYRIVVDCWRMFQKYLIPAMSGSVDWKELHRDALEAGRRYGESEFVKALIFAFLDEIERVEKANGQKNRQ